RAQRVLGDGEEEGIGLNDWKIGSEELLVGLMKEGEGIGGKVVERKIKDNDNIGKYDIIGSLKCRGI
ncbi:hypothetical protein, partial [Staphylococcus hominis]|uniref:hypothetical protein n=1 Tax=Staphylococcus hominis TaxID=1290 RepID=UPI001643C3CE